MTTRKVSKVVIEYTDGTVEQITDPGRSFTPGDIHAGSTIKIVKVSDEIIEELSLNRILLNE